MQADFSEERKWKTALAFELAQAVAEWHLATPEERVSLRGYYKAPEFPGLAEPIERGVPQDENEEIDLPERLEPIQDIANGSSEEEEEVQAVIQSKENDKEEQAMDIVPAEPVFTMKTEESDQPNLGNLGNGEGQERKPDLSLNGEPGNLDDSKNPRLFLADSDAKDAMEEFIQYSHKAEGVISKLDRDALWIQPTELDPLVHSQEKKEEASISKFEWDKLLPDLPAYDMEAPPLKGIDVPRIDEVQTETIPISRFADSQPLLLGALQPALRLQDGVWHKSNQTPVSAEEGKRPSPLSSRTCKVPNIETSIRSNRGP